MSFDWSTFILEIINFLVLVGILKRLFYRPVLDSIARRQASIAQTLQDAKAIEFQAQKIKEEYEQKQLEWAHTCLQAHASFEKEIAARRQQKLLEMEQLMDKEREKRRAVEAQQFETQQRAVEKKAITQAIIFATRLLDRLSSPALDECITKLVAEDLNTLSIDQREMLIAAASESDARLQIISAHPLSESSQSLLKQAIEEIVKSQLPTHVHSDAALRGGIRLVVNSWVLQASFADELAFFQESTSCEG